MKAWVIVEAERKAEEETNSALKQRWVRKLGIEGTVKESIDQFE
jgi:hypothetical protein